MSRIASERVFNFLIVSFLLLNAKKILFFIIKNVY